jgi:hypothetical protein
MPGILGWSSLRLHLTSLDGLIVKVPHAVCAQHFEIVLILLSLLWAAHTYVWAAHETSFSLRHYNTE